MAKVIHCHSEEFDNVLHEFVQPKPNVYRTKGWWRTGAVVSFADYGARGHWFETWPGHRSLWP